MERRIAAILASDMVGYSRLIELDETGTLERQKRHRLELIDPLFEQFNGKIIKLTGDGIIAEFGSVVEAVQCAVTAQKEMAAREADIPEDRKIQYRIAINLGDVVFDDGDVYGDGVNIAARLESLAEPGGVVVSGPVHDLLKSQVEVGYKPMGEQQLKNIATPVRVFQVVEQSEAPRSPTLKKSNRLLTGALAILALGLLGFTAWYFSRPEFTPANPDKLAFEIPDKPSIAVAPFQNAADKTWLSEGIAQAVVFELARSPEMVVVSANAVGSMKDQTPAEISETFGVRYVVSGFVQEQSGRIKVSAQLIDATTGRVLWADQWDRETEDLLAIQDEIAATIQEELEIKLTLGEQARSWRDFLGSAENMRDFVEGRVAFQHFSPEGHENAKEAWTRLYERDPDVPGAKLVIGWLHWQKISLNLSENPSEDYKLAHQMADAEIAAGGNGHAYAFKSTLLLYQGKHDEAIDAANEALRITPGDADVLNLTGSVLFLSGLVEEGINRMTRGSRLEPSAPSWVYTRLAEAYLADKRYEDARGIAESILKNEHIEAFAKPRALTLLAAVAVSENRPQQAEGYVKRLLEAYPKASVEELVRLRTYYRDQEYVNWLASTLRKAGLPDVTPANPDRVAFSIPEKPSIAVTPFTNATSDPEVEWLSIGLSDSVISALTSSPDMIVISRNQLAEMTGLLPGQISETYGVRYVLDGTVQAKDERLRVSARLTDALEGRTLWADRWDRDIDDVFAIQDEIAEAILEELQVKLTLGEQTRSWRSEFGTPENMRDMIRGRVAFQTFRPEDHALVSRLWRGIHDRNPELPAVINLQGWLRWHKVITGMSSDPRADLIEAQKWAQKALDAGGFGHPHALYATASHALGEEQKAIEYAEMAIAADPGEADVLFVAGWILSHRGKPSRGIELLRSGMRLEPDFPDWVATSLLSALVQSGQWHEARLVADAILASQSEAVLAVPLTLFELAAIETWKGNSNEARQLMTRALERMPHANRQSVAQDPRFGLIYKSDQEYVSKWLDALVSAGLPAAAPASPEKMLYDLPDGPSIALLPFESVPKDDDTGYLADSFVGSLITELSFFPDLTVIARGSSFKFRDKNAPTAEISEALGVRYIVQGQLAKQASELRIDVQLIDALTGQYVWTKRYTRPAGDFYKLQDELITDIAREIGGRGDGGVFRAERRRIETISNDELSAIEMFEKSSQAWFKFTEEGNEKSLQVATEMIQRFPQYSRGYAAASYNHMGRIWLNYSADREADLAKCFENADKAIALDAQDYHSHWAKAFCHAIANEHAAAMAEFTLAYQLNPHDIMLRRSYATQVLVPQGEYEDALEVLVASLRLSPGQNVMTNTTVSSIYFILEDYGSAVEYGQREQMRSVANIGWLVAAYWLNGQEERARDTVAELLKKNPDYTSDVFEETRLYAPKEAIARASAALVAAGLPEGP